MNKVKVTLMPKTPPSTVKRVRRGAVFIMTAAAISLLCVAISLLCGSEGGVQAVRAIISEMK